MERKRSMCCGKKGEEDEEEEEWEDRRQSLRKRKRIRYTLDDDYVDDDEEYTDCDDGDDDDVEDADDGDVEDNDDNDDEEQEKDKGLLLVTCGTKDGVLDTKKLARGEECIKCGGCLFTPPAFEEFAGKGSAKKWKSTILYKNEPLQFWFEQGHLSTKGYRRRGNNTAKNKPLQLNYESDDLSGGDSDVQSAEETEDTDVQDDDFLPSREEPLPETREEETERVPDGNKGEAGDSGHPENNEDAPPAADNPEDQSVIKESHRKLITSTPEKQGLHMEPKIVINRLEMGAVLRTDCQCLDVNSDMEEETEDSSATTLGEQSIAASAQTDLLQMSDPAINAGSSSLEIVIKTEAGGDLTDEEKKRKEETETRNKGQLDMSASEDSDRLYSTRNATSHTMPEQQLIQEEILQPGPSSQPQSGSVNDTCGTVSHPSARTCRATDTSRVSADVDTMDLDQLRREKIKMQLKVLKLQEEYYTLKLTEIGNK